MHHRTRPTPTRRHGIRWAEGRPSGHTFQNEGTSPYHLPGVRYLTYWLAVWPTLNLLQFLLHEGCGFTVRGSRSRPPAARGLIRSRLWQGVPPIFSQPGVHFIIPYILYILSYHHTIMLSYYHIMSYYHTIILLSYHTYYHIIILSYYHTIILSYYHTIILSYYHTIILSYYHTIILSYCHTVILSYCHTIILSYYHTRTSGSVPHGRNDFTLCACRSVANRCVADSRREIRIAPKQCGPGGHPRGE